MFSAEAGTLSLSPASLTNGTLTITDSNNLNWIIYTSTNLTSWNVFGSWKVYNGSFSGTLTNNGGSGPFFYRATYNPVNQTNLDTTAAALLLPSSLYNYANPSLPANYLVAPISTTDNTPGTNPVTDLGAQLGRVLFYDKRLSTNQTVACASCHQPAHGFADPRTVSVGFNGSLGTRNAMSLSDARYYSRGHFFWDERASTLESQTLQPIQNPVEMGMSLPTLVTRLSAEPFYTNLFAQVFGSTVITTNEISVALAQFVRSMVSTNSKYDIGLRSNFSNFTAQETQGRQIFFGLNGNTATCAACHALDTFSAANIFNNGLEYP
jgi:cytochrome c peroxidase